jgi:hypothetical protein
VHWLLVEEHFGNRFPALLLLELQLHPVEEVNAGNLYLFALYICRKMSLNKYGIVKEELNKYNEILTFPYVCFKSLKSL